MLGLVSVRTSANPQQSYFHASLFNALLANTFRILFIDFIDEQARAWPAASPRMEEFNELCEKLIKCAQNGEFAQVRHILKDENKDHALWQPVRIHPFTVGVLPPRSSPSVAI